MTWVRLQELVFGTTPLTNPIVWLFSTRDNEHLSCSSCNWYCATYDARHWSTFGTHFNRDGCVVLNDDGADIHKVTSFIQLGTVEDSRGCCTRPKRIYTERHWMVCWIREVDGNNGNNENGPGTCCCKTKMPGRIKGKKWVVVVHKSELIGTGTENYSSHENIRYSAM